MWTRRRLDFGEALIKDDVPRTMDRKLRFVLRVTMRTCEKCVRVKTQRFNRKIQRRNAVNAPG